MPLIESLETEFFPTDAQGFYKKVIQQTIEAMKKSGQVNIVHFSSKVLILSFYYFVDQMCTSNMKSCLVQPYGSKIEFKRK